MSLFSVQIQAVAQLLKSGSPVKSIDLGNTCISDDGAQAYGLMGWARRISDKVLVEVRGFRFVISCVALRRNNCGNAFICPATGEARGLQDVWFVNNKGCHL